MKGCLFALTTCLLFIDGTAFIPAQAQGDLRDIADLTPIVDTLWTRKLTDLGMVDFSACAMGGNPQVLIVASQKELGTPGFRKCLIVFQTETGDTLRTVLNQHTGSVQHMSFARNANVFTTSESGLIKVWRWPDMEVAREFHGPSVNRSAGLLTSDGGRLYDAAAGIMYDVVSGDTLWKWKPSLNFAWPKMTSDDRYIIVHDGHPDFPYQDRGFLLDAATGQVLGSFPGGSGSELIDAIAVSDDGRYVAVSRLYDSSPKDDGSLVVYDRDTRTEVFKRTLHSLEGGQELQFAPGNTGIFVARSVLSEYWGWQYYPAWKQEPTHEFAWTGHTFSSDWTLNFGTKSSLVGVTRFHLTTVPVEGQSRNTSDVLYPNPTDGKISVSVTGMSDGPVRCDITAITGQIVFAGFVVFVSGSGTINPQPPLSPGSYELRLLRGPSVVFSSTLIVR